jgi:hypothetical protein
MNENEIRALFEQLKELAEHALSKLDQSSPSAGPGTSSKKGRQKSNIARSSAPSFQPNTLAFMKKYGKGRPGSEKFAVLLARLVKGSTSKEITRAELKDQWNKMKSVMGGPFNGAFANRAKANGWIDTPKHGVYVLDPSWKEIL